MICIFSLFSEMTTDNPWQVESIQDFSFLKCPECIFDTKTEDTFRKHATDNHPLSLVLFQGPLKDNPIIVKNEILDLIKNEEGSYDPLTIEGYEDKKPDPTEKFKDGNFSGKDVHEEKKPYKCFICGYASAQKGNVKKHINEVHENNIDFQQESGLKRHFDKCHSENSVQCPSCDKSFSQQYTLGALHVL